MNNKIAGILILTFVTFCHPSFVFAQSAKEALLALKKLEVRVESGISYRDYSSAVADAKFPVKLFLESSDSKNDNALSSAFQKAVEHYDFANSVWGQKFSCAGGSDVLFPECGFNMFSKLKRDYPTIPISTDSSGELVKIDTAILGIWKAASQEVQSASDLLSKSELKAEKAKLDFDAMKKENETLRKSIDSLQKGLDDLTKENDDLKKERDTIKAENDYLKSKMATKKKK